MSACVPKHVQVCLKEEAPTGLFMVGSEQFPLCCSGLVQRALQPFSPFFALALWVNASLLDGPATFCPPRRLLTSSVWWWKKNCVNLYPIGYWIFFSCCVVE